jgi:uncharacterized protein YcnI
MKRLAFLAVTVIALAATAAPAWAHEEINPSSVPTGKPVFFMLTAANEKNVNLTKITLTAPQGLNFGATTRDPAGWTSNKSDTVITWTGGSVKPDQFEQWGFEIEGADQPGTLNYKVTLGYSDGTSDDVQVPITVVAASATGSATGAGSSTAAKSSSGEGRANVALALAIVALAAAAAAAVVALRRRGDDGTGAAAGAGARAATTTSGAQDW